MNPLLQQHVNIIANRIPRLDIPTNINKKGETTNESTIEIMKATKDIAKILHTLFHIILPGFKCKISSFTLLEFKSWFCSSE